MTGWNLPPGCNVSDLPGNRPEDLAAEAAYDKLYEELTEANLFAIHQIVEDDWEERLTQFILKKMGEAHLEGYQQAVADEAMQKEMEEAEKAAAEYWEFGRGKW